MEEYLSVSGCSEMYQYEARWAIERMTHGAHHTDYFVLGYTTTEGEAMEICANLNEMEPNSNREWAYMCMARWTVQSARKAEVRPLRKANV